MQIILKPIGYIYTPFNDIKEMPIQAKGAVGISGKIIINEEFIEGLQDLEQFSHIHVIYYLHKCKEHALKVIPFLDNIEHGIFATRSPKRPNKIGMSILKLNKIIKNEIYVENVDMLNETPLLDIKPYVPEFDVITENVNIGWYKNKTDDLNNVKSDDRFRN